jgi:pyrroline-5-carboxylate reductase
LQRKNPTWGIIGVGQLGACIAEGIYRSRAPFDLVLSPRGKARVRELAERFPVAVGTDNQEVVDRADHVILAARPDQLVGVAGALRFRPDQTVVSVAAALGRSSVQQAVGPARAVRAMPVLSATVGDSPTCIHPPDDTVAGFFEHLGPIHMIGDEDTFAVAAVAASYYVWVYSLMETSAAWLHRNGVELETGRALVAQMTRAAASRCLDMGTDMGALAEEIARPDTFTRVGMDRLRETDALQAWSDASQVVLDAKRERGR